MSREREPMKQPMKRQNLFQPPLYHGTPHCDFKALMSPAHQPAFMALLDFMRAKLGKLTALDSYAYRVTNTNYVVVTLTGDTTLWLMINLVGYTEFPLPSELNGNRLNINVIDTADAFWLVRLLETELKGGCDEVA